MSSSNGMRKGITVAVIIAVCSLGPVSSAAVATTAPPETSRFSVDFSGIIVHVAHPAAAPTLRRAVIVEANLFKPHSPMLYVPVPADPKERADLIAALRSATGKIPRCGQDQCGVRIGGIAMRIRGNGKAPTTPLDVDPSFTCLLPSLGYELKGPIKPDLVRTGTATRAELPSGAALGYFEIENGKLEAYPFDSAGFYYPADQQCPTVPSDPKLCRQFADIVTWSGYTEDPAILEISSNKTSWKWTPIPIANRGRLMISVENLANDHVHTSEHFSLNEKMLSNTTLPQICPCAKAYEECKPAGGITAINAVPGCSNSSWP